MDHTPGQWFIWSEELELDPETSSGAPVICAPGKDGAVDICEVSADAEEYVANARLIVEAPRLLDLAEIVAMGNMDPDVLMRTAQEIIDRVKGRSHGTAECGSGQEIS
jgi:hypothetical protein